MKKERGGDKKYIGLAHDLQIMIATSLKVGRESEVISSDEWWVMRPICTREKRSKKKEKKLLRKLVAITK